MGIYIIPTLPLSCDVETKAAAKEVENYNAALFMGYNEVKKFHISINCVNVKIHFCKRYE